MTEAINKKKTIINSIYVYFGEIISKAILFLFNAIVARQLGVIDYGLYTFSLSIGLILIGVIDFGTNNFVLKKISEDKSRNIHYLWKVIQLEWILSILSLVGLFIFLKFVNYEKNTKMIIIILYFSLVFENITNVFRNVLKALERFGLDGLISVLSSVLRIVFALGFYYIIHDIYGLSIGVVFSTLIALLISFFIAKRAIKDISYEQIEIAENMFVIFKSCSLFALPIIIKGIYLRIDAILVKNFITAFNLGLYNSVLKLLFVQYFLPNGIVQVVFPSLNRLFCKKDYDNINTIFPKIFTILVVSFNIIQMFQVIFASYIIQLIYGTDFMKATMTYQLIIMSFLFTSTNVLLNFVFIANNNIQLTNKYYVFGIIIKLLLTIVLTKQLNILGAAVAFLISEILQLLVFLIGCIHYNIKYKNSYFLILFNIMLLDIVLFLLPINIFVKLITLLGVSLIILQCFQINLLSYIKFICKNIGKKHMREGVN